MPTIIFSLFSCSTFIRNRQQVYANNNFKNYFLVWLKFCSVHISSFPLKMIYYETNDDISAVNYHPPFPLTGTNLSNHQSKELYWLKLILSIQLLFKRVAGYFIISKSNGIQCIWFNFLFKNGVKFCWSPISSLKKKLY